MSAATILNRMVLVLNKSWVAFDVWSLKDAITHLFKVDKETGQPKARIVKYSLEETGTYSWSDWAKLMPKEDEKAIRSAENKFKIPEVIVLTDYNGSWKPKSSFSRRMIYTRDNNQCQYCGCKPGTRELNLDHIVPTSRGGKTTWENVCLSCIKCNSKKANRLMSEAGMKFFYKDYKPFKPKKNFLDIKDVRCESWKAFVSAAYWDTLLQD